MAAAEASKRYLAVHVRQTKGMQAHWWVVDSSSALLYASTAQVLGQHVCKADLHKKHSRTGTAYSSRPGTARVRHAGRSGRQQQASTVWAWVLLTAFDVALINDSGVLTWQ